MALTDTIDKPRSNPQQQASPTVAAVSSGSVAYPSLAIWRLRGIGILRIVFGLVWAIDAWFKWQPDFINNFTGYLTGSLEGQPQAVQSWINFWINTVNIDPTFFAYAVAIGETAVALGLIFGVFSNLTNIGGILLAIVIWSTAEAFGGPYQAGSTDIGAAIIYSLVFAGLFLANAGLYVGFDRYLSPRLKKWSFLASGPVEAKA
jgi:uncharacterized membrane protein YphA (DoxX/SURF4 family)